VTHDESRDDLPETKALGAEGDEPGGPAKTALGEGDEPGGPAKTALDAEADEPHAKTPPEATEDVRGAETEPDLEGAPPPATRVRSLRLPRWAELVLPAVLAAGAMGAHWMLNVPDKIVHSPKDQGAKDKEKEKDKKKKDAERRRAKRDESRTSEQLEADWEKYGELPFDDEPTRTAWARRHQVVISRGVVEARKQAFAGAPETANVQVASTTCRTIRCRFQLRSSFAHELDLMTSTLERLHEGGEPVFRSFDVEPLPPEPAHAGKPAEAGKPELKHVVQVTVGFVDDDTDSNALEISPATPEAEPENGGEAEPENGGDPNEAGEPEPEPENGGDPNEDGS
jgi:hypothetical protein